MTGGRRRRAASPARDDVPGRPEGDRGLYHTVRLRHLYEIGKLLTGFESVERTVPPVLALVAKTLPIRSAVFILKESEGEPRTIGWLAEGESEDRLRAALAHARETFAYFVRPEVARNGGQRGEPGQPPGASAEGRAAPGGKENFILLPLLIAGQPIFGALQFEGLGPSDEIDLLFVNAVAVQLAIAVDRQAMIGARQARAEARENEQRLLANVSAVVGSSLGYRDTLAALARSAVPQFADLCLIDEVGEDGVVRRREVVLAQADRLPELTDRLRSTPPRPGEHSAQSRVLASRQPILFETMADPAAQGLAGSEEADALRDAGVGSMIAVPLIARGLTLGVLTFATSGARRRYTPRELAVAEELARRAAIAVDNARLYEQARQATLARDNLLAIVSHDLRNPLSVILTNLSMLLRRVEADDGRRSRHQLESIQRAADRMNRMIGDLLETASIEAGRLSVERRPLDVAPLVTDTIEALRALAANKSQRFETDLPSELPAVHGDGARLQQALVNLVGNAIKFTPDGGAIVVGARPAGDAVRFFVKDSGPGIPEDELPNVFDRFWQAARTARLGTGLGLFIVKGIVEAHGGTVWVDSQVGQGSTFSFTIPLAAPAPHSLGPVEDRAAEP